MHTLDTAFLRTHLTDRHRSVVVEARCSIVVILYQAQLTFSRRLAAVHSTTCCMLWLVLLTHKLWSRACTNCVVYNICKGPLSFIVGRNNILAVGLWAMRHQLSCCSHMWC